MTSPLNTEQRWFERLPEALIAVRQGTLRFIGASDRARSLLAIPDQPIERRTLPEVILPDDLAEILDAVRNGDRSELKKRHVRDYHGKLRPADLSFSVLRDQDLILLGIHDASPVKELEDQLRQAHKMEALGMLAGGIAHDFNNLLTIIAGYSQMLLSSVQMTSERDRTAVEQVLKASERAADLTSQLLAFSRRQSVQPRVLELNRVVDQAIAMLRRLIGEDVELRISKFPEAGKIHADMGQMQQMLMNLAINARDAMPEGGSLTIRTDVGDLQGDKPGRYAVLEVADTGTGMDEVTRHRVFEPFFTTKGQGKGTGLGLSTVYGIVRQCGGRIDLSSEPGKGTRFRVYLPSIDAAPSEDVKKSKESRGGHETVLLVEDEEGVRRMVHTALERKGYRMLVASSGPEALRLVRDFDGPLDLVVTDVIMPQMNGRELVEKLRADRPSAGVLFISGYPGNTLLKAGTLLGDSAFLQKPFAPDDLTAKVRELLDTRPAGIESAAR